MTTLLHSQVLIAEQKCSTNVGRLKYNVKSSIVDSFLNNQGQISGIDKVVMHVVL